MSPKRHWHTSFHLTCVFVEIVLWKPRALHVQSAAYRSKQQYNRIIMMQNWVKMKKQFLFFIKSSMSSHKYRLLARHSSKWRQYLTLYSTIYIVFSSIHLHLYYSILITNSHPVNFVAHNLLSEKLNFFFFLLLLFYNIKINRIN